MKDGRFTAADIYEMLKKRYQDSRQWLCAREVGNTTGGGLRRLDFVAANCYASKDFGVHAYEVKVSKSDLRRELEDTPKHTIFFDDIDDFTIVAPSYVLDAEYRQLIPPKWGIVIAEARNNSQFEGGYETNLKTLRRPLALHDEQEHRRRMRRGFAMELLRAISTQDAKCHDHDELQAALSEGERHGYESGMRAAGDYRRRYEEMQWAERLAHTLRIYTAQDFEKNAATVEMLRRLMEEARWFDNRMAEVKKAADGLADAYRALLDAQGKGGAA